MREFPLTAKMGWRNIHRNARRTFLSVLGITVSCSISLIQISMTKGKIELFMRNVAEGGIGHFRVADAGWLESRERNLRLKDTSGELARLRSQPEVSVATPRARVQAMMAMGTHIQGTELVGVDPRTEPASFRSARSVSKGRYLAESGQHEVVVGQALADALKSDVGDSLVITVVDKGGEMRSQMFEVVGLVSLGNDQMEKAFAQTNLKEVNELTGLDGAGEIAVLLRHPEQLDEVAAKAGRLLPQGDSLFTWKEIAPSAEIAVRANEGSAGLLTFIFVFVAFLGVSSAQLTAVLERRREFAVLSAIGTKGRTLIGFIAVESLFLGTLSLVATLVISIPATLYLQEAGIRVLSGSSRIAVMGGAFEPIIHGQFGPWIVSDAIFLCYCATLFSGIYPAIFAARIDPASALRTAQ